MRFVKMLIVLLALAGQMQLHPPPQAFGEDEDNEKSDQKEKLSREELEIIKHLSLLENLEYLEEEDLSFLEDYQNVAEEDGGQDDE